MLSSPIFSVFQYMTDPEFAPPFFSWGVPFGANGVKILKPSDPPSNRCIANTYASVVDPAYRCANSRLCN
jgi:hypothetical protein